MKVLLDITIILLMVSLVYAALMLQSFASYHAFERDSRIQYQSFGKGRIN